MAKQDVIRIDGEVIECLANTNFRVRLDNDMVIICHLCGQMRKNNIKVITGDKVSVEMSPYDLTKGRINKRL